jgi:hypothetical protein
VRARGSGARRLCHGQVPTAAAGPRPKRNRAEERQCGVVRAYQVKRLVIEDRKLEDRSSLLKGDKTTKSILLNSFIPC